MEKFKKFENEEINENLSVFDLQRIINKKDIINVIPVSYSEEGFQVYLGNGFYGLLPKEEASIYQKDYNEIGLNLFAIEKILGNVICVKIISYDDGKIVVSRKEAMIEAKEFINNSFKEDSTLLAKVLSIKDSCAFIDLGAGVEGVLHISELSQTHLYSMEELINKEDFIEVLITSEEEKYLCSNKKVFKDEFFWEGDLVLGTIRSHAEGNKSLRFVELSRSQTGLLTTDKNYDEGTEAIFKIAKILIDGTIIVSFIRYADPSCQRRKYFSSLKAI